MSDQYKFFTIFSTLEADEVKVFNKYLRQEHAGEETTLCIFDFYLKFHPDYDKAPDIQKAHRKIFKTDTWEPDKQGKKMLNAFHDLSQWLRTFLIQQKVAQKDSLLQQNIWLQILWEKGLKGEFSHRAADLGKQLALQEAGGFFSVAEQIKSGFLHNLYLAETQRTGDVQALQQGLKKIMGQCNLIKLKMECEWLTVQKIWPSHKLGSDAVLPEDIDSSPLAKIYEAIFNLLKTNEETYYREVLSLLERHVKQIEAAELADIFQYLRNYTSHKITSGGGQNWVLEGHYLNKKSLEYQVFEKNKTLQPITFTNIVNVACSVNDIDWAKDFVTGQNHLVPNHAREESILMANAIIADAQKKYKVVIALLSRNHFKDFYYEIRTKVLLLKSHYETISHENDLLILQNLCANFIGYLNRHKKKRDANVFEPAMAFAKIFEMLILRRKTQKELLDEINNWPKMFSRDWLIEKVHRYTPLR